MIDEKKLIEDLLCNDGMEFEVGLAAYTPEAVKNAFFEFANKLKEGFVDLIKSQPSFGWISTKEQLPKPFHSVLLNIPSYAPMPTVHEGFFVDTDEWMTFCGDSYTTYEVPFWMPMPEPQKVGEDQ